MVSVTGASIYFAVEFAPSIYTNSLRSVCLAAAAAEGDCRRESLGETGMRAKKLSALEVGWVTAGNAPVELIYKSDTLPDSQRLPVEPAGTAYLGRERPDSRKYTEWQRRPMRVFSLTSLPLSPQP